MPRRPRASRCPDRSTACRIVATTSPLGERGLDSSTKPTGRAASPTGTRMERTCGSGPGGRRGAPGGWPPSSTSNSNLLPHGVSMRRATTCELPRGRSRRKGNLSRERAGSSPCLLPGGRGRTKGEVPRRAGSTSARSEGTTHRNSSGTPGAPESAIRTPSPPRMRTRASPRKAEVNASSSRAIRRTCGSMKRPAWRATAAALAARYSPSCLCTWRPTMSSAKAPMRHTDRMISAA